MEVSPADWDYVAERADSFVGRTWVFARLRQFLAGPPGTFVLRGDPGTGKTAIAARLALASCGRLAGDGSLPADPGTISAAAFCRSGKATVAELTQQLADQLERSVAGFAAARLAAAAAAAGVGVGVGNITDVTVTVAGDVGPDAVVAGVLLPPGDDKRSFDANLAVPLRRLRERPAAPPVVLLVDAVDEAVAADQANNFSGKLSELDGIHLIVTCRPDPRVLADFRRASEIVDLLADAPSGRDDVRDYVADRLRGHGPERTVSVLTDRIAREADGNFLYAFHVTGTLGQSEALARLDENAAARLPLPADGLPGVYADFLDRQITRDERRWREELRPVLAGISVARGDGLTRPQLAAAASQFAGQEFSETKVDDITRGFGQFLDKRDLNGPFRVYHQSFARFLTDPEQNALAIDQAEANRAVVRAFVRTTAERQLQGDNGTGDPYLAAHLAAHAAGGGRSAWDDLADHPRILDRLDPGSVAIAGLPALAAYPLPAEILGVIGDAHRLAAVPPDQRTGLRQLAMARYAGAAPRRAEPDPAALWFARWAHLVPKPIHRTLSCTAGFTTGGTVEAFTGTDGRSYLAIGDPEGTLRVWDPVTDTPVGPPLDEWRPAVVASFPVVAFNDAAGRPLLAAGGCPDNAVRVWDPLAGTATSSSFTLPWGRVNAVAVLPAPGERLILAAASTDTRGLVYRWDAIEGTALGPPLSCGAEVLALAAVPVPGGRTLLAAGTADGAVRLWDPSAGTPVGLPMTGHTDRIEAVTAFSSRDGRRLLATASRDGTVRIWDPLSGRPVRPPLTGHTDLVWDITMFRDPAGRPLLATGGGDDTVRIWDPLAGRQVGSPITGHEGWVTSLAALPAPDGRPLLATSGSDGTVRIWDPANADAEQAAAAAESFADQAYRPCDWRTVYRTCAVAAFRAGEGRPVVAAGTDSGIVRMWDAASGSAVGRPWNGSWRVTALAAFASRKGQPLLAVVAGNIRIVDPLAGKQVGQPLRGPAEAWTVLALPAGKGRTLLAVGYEDGAIWLWDPLARARVGRPLQCPGWVRALTLFPARDGRTLLAAASDEPVPGSDFDHCTTLHVWDPFAGVPVHQPLTSSTWVWALTAFTAADGRTLLAAGGNDYRNAPDSRSAHRHHHPVQVWDPAVRAQVSPPLTGHASPVYALAEITAGRGMTLLASSWGSRIRMWDPTDLTELAAIDIDSEVNDLTPVGEDLLVGTNDGVMMITPNIGRLRGGSRY